MLGKYTPIEYLESTGTQWINTLYNPSNNTSIEISCNITKYNRYETVFCGRQAQQNKGFGIIVTQENTTRFIYMFGNVETQFGADDNQFGKDIIVSLSSTTARVGDVTGSVSNNTFSSSYPIYLFNLNNNNSPAPYCEAKMKLYYCRIYEGGIIVRNLIPVRVGQVGYLYDTVSGQLFENSGTGSFVLGPDV